MKWTKVPANGLNSGSERTILSVWVAGIELKIKSCLEGFHWTAYDHVFHNMSMWSEDPFSTKEEAQRDAEDAVERYLAVRTP